MPVVRDTFRFLQEYATKPGRVGAVAPSSYALAEAACHGIGLETAKAVVEFGPGTGSITPSILKRMPDGCTFWAIEASERFVERMRERHPSVRLYHDTAENVEAHCRELGVKEVDCIVSGLPFASFPEPLQRSLMAAVVKVLKPGGVFTTFGYWMGLLTPAGQRFRKIVEETFAEVERTETVWLNVPPGFVYRGVTSLDKQWGDSVADDAGETNSAVDVEHTAQKTPEREHSGEFAPVGR